MLSFSAHSLVVAPRVLACLFVSALLVFALGACGDDDRPPPPPPIDMGIRFDSGDGGTIESDAEVADMPFVPADGGCALEGEIVKLATDNVDRAVRLVDVAVSGETFVVAWTDARSAVADAYVYAWPTVAASGTPHRITEDFAPTRDVQLAARTDGFVVGWVDNTTGGFEVFARPLDAAGAPSGLAQRITNNVLREDSLRLTGLGGAATMAAWIESDGLGGAAVTHAVQLGATGAAVGTPGIATAAPRMPTELTLSRLGAGGAALAWMEGGTVYLQPLTSAGAFVGAAAPMNGEAIASGGVSLALDEAGGAVAFDVRILGTRPEVRMSRIDATGSLVPSSEAVLTMGSSTGADPAVARYATGYVVAYRTTAMDGSGMIRLAFATSTGEYSHSIDVAATTMATGGGPRIAVAADGRILVAWQDADTTSAEILAAKVICE